MKPRIFIAMHYLEIGGAESALIGLLQSLDPEKVDVDLFLYSHRGELMKYIPSWVNLLPEIKSYSVLEAPMSQALKNGQLRVVYGRMKAKFLHKKYLKSHPESDGSAILGYIGKYTTPLLPSLHHLGEYDLAISFLTPHNIVLNKVSAKKKICWIHTDYTKIDVDKDLELPVWDGFDNIISISPDVTSTFCQVFPSLRNKIIEIENILSPEFIRKRAEEIDYPIEFNKDSKIVKLLTIGRYSYPKKLEEIPIICKGLRDKGLDVKWYIIGYGSSEEESKIKAAIDQSGMPKYVHLLGKRENPYPYIKACDWYVQPSRYEGKSIVVREAQILRKPVIITNYPTSKSQVIDMQDGVIVPMEIKKCISSIASALIDKELKERIVFNLSNYNYGNELEIEKIYKITKDKIFLNLQ